MPSPSPDQLLTDFLAKFTPEIAAAANACLERMRARLPGTMELVYDNYNALAIGFGPTERTSEAVFSIAVFPRWVSLFFLRGKSLPDPDKLLRGTGNVVRHIVLKNADDIDTPAVQELMAQALSSAEYVPDARRPRRIVIKSVSPKQRPRRPVPGK